MNEYKIGQNIADTQGLGDIVIKDILISPTSGLKCYHVFVCDTHDMFFASECDLEPFNTSAT